MKVSEYIKLLQELPQDMEVLANREGTYYPATGPEEEDFYQFLAKENWLNPNHLWDGSSVDYYPEVTKEDNDYQTFKAVIIT